mgnify:CR=1 FL=1
MKRKGFFDKLEDRIRLALSHRPILYAFVGGVGVVLFWRGVWHTADLFPILTGPVSILISILILLATGLFVSFFVGDDIIIAGLKEEKKISDKTEEEIKKEGLAIRNIGKDVDGIKETLGEMREVIDKISKEK